MTMDSSSPNRSPDNPEGSAMTDHKDHPIPHGYRLIDDNMLSFLWFQAAGITLHYFGIGTIQPASDAERIDCVHRLGELWREHVDLLPDEAAVIMDWLITAANDLSAVSGH
jgi:hypothetical protein